MSEDKIIAKLWEHDKLFDKIHQRFEQVDNKLEEHDKFFDRIVAKLIEHDERFDEMLTKKEFYGFKDDLAVTLDTMMGILKKLDQEMVANIFLLRKVVDKV